MVGDGCAVTTGRRVAVYLMYAYPTRRSQTPVMRTDIDELVNLCCNVYVSDMIYDSRWDVLCFCVCYTRDTQLREEGAFSS